MRPWFLLIPVLLLACTATHFQRDEAGAVVFYLESPQARSVQIAASYNQFALQDARRADGGLWTVRLPRHIAFSYFYLVDGRPFVPACETREQDDFGQANCIFSPRL